MKTTRGLFFRSTSGSEYYYDDCSGLCFPVTTSLKDVLAESYIGNVSTKEKDRGYWEKYTEKRFRSYGAFFGDEGGGNSQKVVTEDYLEKLISGSGYQQLLLVLTDRCNLSCRYCIYSDNYPYGRPSENNVMSTEVAIAATQYYLKAIDQIRKRNPAHPAFITFYGGEPLLNFQAIESVVRYVREKGKTDITLSISTNGSLLDDRICDFLVANRFSIAISIDGPKSEHDRNRVAKNGQGSFDVVYNKIVRLWTRYPNYPFLIFLVTVDLATDLEKTRDFFSSDKRFVRSLFIFSQVSPNFTNYYAQFSAKQRMEYLKRAKRLKGELLVSGVELVDCDPVLKYMFGMPMFLYFNRRIIGKIGRGVIPATSTCLPGEKICVLPSGEFQVCEKTMGLKVGSLNGGLDFRLIKKIINDYNSAIALGCSDCSISRICGTCFAHFWNGNYFSYPDDKFCLSRREGARSMLADTWSLLEKRPDFFRGIGPLAEEIHKRGKALIF